MRTEEHNKQASKNKTNKTNSVSQNCKHNLKCVGILKTRFNIKRDLNIIYNKVANFFSIILQNRKSMKIDPVMDKIYKCISNRR